MIEAKGACSGIVLGNAGTERFQRTVRSPGPRRGYQPRKRTFSPCEQDGRSERKMRRVGRGPLLMVLWSCRVGPC